MSEATLNLSAMRHIRLVREVGSAADGQAVVVNLQMEDGTHEWFAINHARVGRLVSSVLFGSSVAANDRLAAQAKQPSVGEQSTLIDVARVNASSAAGADYVCLRMVVGEGVNLDFRLPLAVVPALQEKITQAVSIAQGDLSSSAS